MTGRRLAGAAAVAGIPLAAGLLLSAVPAVVAAAVPVAFFAMGLVIVVRLVATSTDDPDLNRRVWRWAIAAYAAHLLIGVAITSSHQLTTYFGGDALQYHEGAQQLISHWRFGTDRPIGVLAPGKSGFTWVLTGLYLLFGPYPIAGLALNAFFGAGLVPLMTDTTRRLFGRDAAWFVPPLVLLPVGFLLWPSQLLREAGILFFIAGSVNAATRLSRRTRLAALVTLTAFLVVLFTFRHYMALTLSGGIIVGLLFGRRGLGGLHAGGSAAALVAMLVFGLGLGYQGLEAVQNTSFQEANLIRQDSARGANSGFLPEGDVSSGRRALTYLPLAIPRFVLGPFPWEIRGGRQLLVLPDLLVWWALLPAAWRGLTRAWRLTRRSVFVLLLPAGAVTIVLSLLVANYGTVVRSRMQVMLLLCPLIALGIASARRRAPVSARQERVTLPSAWPTPT